MRKIITTTFITLDGVMQAPGGSQEDTSEGFKFGGWQLSSEKDEVASNILNKFFTIPFEMLLGRRTYDIFAGYWPNHPEIELIAKPFNSTKKYVVTHNPFELTWNNSSLITASVVEEIKKLKEMDAPDLWVWGSSNLIQTLLKNSLIDRMHIWIYPVTIGVGKRLFAEGTRPERFKMIDSKITPTGIIFATYEPLEDLKQEQAS